MFMFSIDTFFTDFIKYMRFSIFFFQFVGVLTSESFLYLILRDYTLFVRRLTNRFAAINVLYVKLFQAVAFNNHLIDDATNHVVMEFVDNVPRTTQDIRFDDLIDICDKYDIVIPDGYEKPIKSGMISIVYKGLIRKDGNVSPCIIKMKRKNIESRLSISVENIQIFLYLLSLLPVSIINRIKKYQIFELIHRNIEAIKQQTSFPTEVLNMTRIRNNCKNLKYVVIPEALSEVTMYNPHFIVMEYIEGMKISEIAKEDNESFVKQVLKFGFVTLIVHGITHADLHTGNILFIKDKSDAKYPYKIGVIDFGIVYELDPAYKDALFDALIQMFDSSPEETAAKMLHCGIISPPGILDQIPRHHYNDILQFTADLVKECIHTSKRENQLHMYSFLLQLKEYIANYDLDKYDIQPSDHLIKSLFIFAMGQSITFTLCCNNLTDMLNKVIHELFHAEIILSDDSCSSVNPCVL
jgi:predicted unusual protein kinase regulating ubiquinone biosynthesis (AarF/ABC1/UbiB family)